MGVWIDEAGCDDQAARVDRSPSRYSRARRVTDEHDAIALHADVGSTLGCASAVHHRAVSQQDVHDASLCREWTRENHGAEQGADTDCGEPVGH
jgi:hypothetical protein